MTPIFGTPQIPYTSAVFSDVPYSLGQFHRRIKSRIGGRGAITATAHKLSRLVYRMLRYGTEYVARSLAEYEARVREKLERSLRRKARALGYELVPKGPIIPAPS